MKLSGTIALIVFFTAGCSTLLFSQNIGKGTVGFDLGVPLGKLNRYTRVGTGVSATFEIPAQVFRSMNWTAQTGMMSFFGKSTDGFTHSTILIPMMGGVKYYLDQRYSGFYGSAELGFVFATQYTRDHEAPNHKTSAFQYDRVAISPGIGYQTSDFDFSARFQVMSGATYFNLRAAYIIPFHQK